jgi:multidrug efflux system outer membrane protein
MKTSTSWRESADDTTTVVNTRWWEQFNDVILNELIQEALAENENLKIATARIAEFRARLGITASQLLPQLNAEGSFSRRKISESLNEFNSSSTSTYSSSYENMNGGAGIPPFSSSDFFSSFRNDYRTVLSAAYQLDLFGRIQSATDASLADLLAQIEARRTVILTLVSSVATGYLQLRQYDRQLAISIQTVESREKSYNLARIRFLGGLTSELEVKQAASELDEAIIQTLQFKVLIAQQENLLSVLVGHPPTAISRGRAVNEWTLPPEVPAGLPSDLLEQRPDILQAEEQLIAANARIGEARALYFPDISLTGYYGYESAELHHLFTDPSKVWQWAGNLLQPIFAGGRISSTVDLTKAVRSEALHNYQQTVLVALQEVNNALIAHRISKEALQAEYRRVKNLTEYLHLATLQYENGLVDYLNVLDAERKLFDSQLDLAQSQATVFTTLVSLYTALGGGWIIDAENLMKEEKSCK